MQFYLLYGLVARVCWSSLFYKGGEKVKYFWPNFTQYRALLVPSVRPIWQHFVCLQDLELFTISPLSPDIVILTGGQWRGLLHSSGGGCILQQGKRRNSGKKIHFGFNPFPPLYTRHLSFKCNFVKLSSCHGQLKRSVRVTALTADLPLDWQLPDPRSRNTSESCLQGRGDAEASPGASPSPTSLATMSAFNHVYNIKEYFYISPAAATEHKVCPAHNNVNSVRINKVRHIKGDAGHCFWWQVPSLMAFLLILMLLILLSLCRHNGGLTCYSSIPGLCQHFAFHTKTGL